MECSKTKIRSSLTLLTALFILTACCRPAPNLTPAAKLTTPLPADCWLLKPMNYRLRQSAELKFQNKRELLEGFMELDLQQQQAHLVIFTSLGVTLLKLEIKSESFNFTTAGPHNRREQRFAAAVAGAVQKIFLSLRDCHKRKSEFAIEFSSIHGTMELSKISTKPAVSGWMVTYADYQDYPCGRLPQRIILQNNRPEFKLTLWLHNADILKK